MSDGARDARAVLARRPRICSGNEIVVPLDESLATSGEALKRKLKLLDAAGKLDDLAIPAGNRLERLKGGHAGRYSIRVNEQYRVTFHWESGNAYEVCVEDYH